MTTGERVFSVVRGRLYERLPALALPLGKLSCREADVTACRDGRAARRSLRSGFLEREFLAGSDAAGAADAASAAAPRARPSAEQEGPARKRLWDTACDLAVLLVRHALLPQEREAPAAFSARCKLQLQKSGQRGGDLRAFTGGAGASHAGRAAERGTGRAFPMGDGARRRPACCLR